jgi:hypothetical protein
MSQSTYSETFPDLVRAYAEQGATDREIAEMLEVSERTLYRWKHAHPGLAEALTVGKDVADRRVEQSLYRKATGYSYDAVKIMQYEGKPVIVPYVEHIAPDTTAMIFWLKNRRPDLWREKSEVDVNMGEDLAARLAAARARVREHNDELYRLGKHPLQLAEAARIAQEAGEQKPE